MTAAMGDKSKSFTQGLPLGPVDAQLEQKRKATAPTDTDWHLPTVRAAASPKPKRRAGPPGCSEES